MWPVLALWACSGLAAQALRPDSYSVFSLGDEKPQAPCLRVLSFDRPSSLKRLLDQLNAIDYGGDSGHLQLTISIDHPSAGASNATVDSQQKTVQVAEDFQFLHGAKTVQARPSHNGIVKQWVDAWMPDEDAADSHPACLILEDDLMLSPHAWTWLRGALHAYGRHADKIASFGLQRQVVVPATSSTRGLGHMPPTSNGRPYLYKLLATWGFFALRPSWIEFRTYMKANFVEGHPEDILFQNQEMIISKWHKGGPSHMWSYWFVMFMLKSDRFTLYSDVGDNLALCANFQEKGLHYNGALKGLDTPVLAEKVQALYHFDDLENLTWYDWDAQPILHDSKTMLQ